MELTGAGVTGNTTLAGSEDALTVYDFKVTIDQVRNAVSSTEWDTKKPVYEQWPLIKDALVTWFGNWQDNTLITKLTASPTGTSAAGVQRSVFATGRAARRHFTFHLADRAGVFKLFGGAASRCGGGGGIWSMVRLYQTRPRRVGKAFCRAGAG